MKFCIVFIVFSTFVASAIHAQTITLTPLVDSVVVGQSAGFLINIDTASKQVGSVYLDFSYPTNQVILESICINSLAFDQQINITSHSFALGKTGRDGLCGQALVGKLWVNTLKPGHVTMGLDNFEARFGPHGDLVEGFLVIPGEIDIIAVPEPSSFLAFAAGSILMAMRRKSIKIGRAGYKEVSDVEI